MEENRKKKNKAPPRRLEKSTDRIRCKVLLVKLGRDEKQVQAYEEEHRRARYLREELGEVSDPEYWMQLHHHDYDSSESESESGPETTEPQDSPDAGTLTAPEKQNLKCRFIAKDGGFKYVFLCSPLFGEDSHVY